MHNCLLKLFLGGSERGREAAFVGARLALGALEALFKRVRVVPGGQKPPGNHPGDVKKRL
jgi:hypothetical protein